MTLVATVQIPIGMGAQNRTMEGIRQSAPAGSKLDTWWRKEKSLHHQFPHTLTQPDTIARTKDVRASGCKQSQRVGEALTAPGH